MSGRMQSVAPNLWLLSYPLKMLGADLRRNATVIRLASGKLIIHSTAPFTAEDIAAIKSLGEPTWLVDAFLRHDTFAKEGRAAFPAAAYLAPVGFSNNFDVSTEPLLPPPAEWSKEIAAAEVGGAPELGEVVLLHRPSRTLIVADLIFHFPGDPGLWTAFLLRLATVGGRRDPGMTVPYKKAITDPAAYAASVRKILEWDFDRIIVGHGEAIESGGKEKLRSTLQAAGVPGL